jgi:iron-sulfur cluster repair protein YtfE (RIC family)
MQALRGRLDSLAALPGADAALQALAGGVQALAEALAAHICTEDTVLFPLFQPPGGR